VANFRESNARWFSAGTQVKGDKLLAMKYNGVYRFPGGKEKSGNGRNDKTPEETLVAEMGEEVFEGGVGLVTSMELVHEVPKVGHSKYFYLATLEGELRKKIKKEVGEDEVLDPPEFVQVDQLAKTIFWSHLPALKKICQRLESTHISFTWALNEIELRERAQAGKVGDRKPGFVDSRQGRQHQPRS
jgi:hypothetical protein